MKIKKFCATAALLAAACSMQAGAMAADAPATAASAGTAAQSAVGTAAATEQTAKTDAATGELLPSDVQTSSDGLELKKIYDVEKTTSPDKIPQADFERGGFKYTFEDLLKIEMPDVDRKVHSETVTVSSSSNNSDDVLSLLPKSKTVNTTDGYSGTAYLDISSISTKVAGTESVSNDLSATREYPGMTEMDMENIPKSITENGHTLRFADVEWKSSSDEVDNFGTTQTTYTAVVSYTGTATSTRTTGYTITATYAGEVSRRNNDRVRYIAVYSGAPIDEIEPIPEDEQGHEQDPPDMTGLLDEEQQEQTKEHKAPALSWVLCGVFAILMLLFAFRPPMCRRMMQQMQQGAQAVRDKINNETERIKSEKKAEEDAERERQQIFGPLDKIKAAIRNRRQRKGGKHRIPALAAPSETDEQHYGNSDELAAESTDDAETEEIAGLDDAAFEHLVVQPDNPDASRQHDGADDDDEFPGIRL